MPKIKGKSKDHPNAWHTGPTLYVTGNYGYKEGKISYSHVEESIWSGSHYYFSSKLCLCYYDTKPSLDSKFVLSPPPASVTTLVTFKGSNDGFRSNKTSGSVTPKQYKYAYLAMHCGQTPDGCTVGYGGYVAVSDLIELADISIGDISPKNVLLGNKVSCKVNHLTGTGWKGHLQVSTKESFTGDGGVPRSVNTFNVKSATTVSHKAGMYPNNKGQNTYYPYFNYSFTYGDIKSVHTENKSHVKLLPPSFITAHKFGGSLKNISFKNENTNNGVRNPSAMHNVDPTYTSPTGYFTKDQYESSVPQTCIVYPDNVSPDIKLKRRDVSGNEVVISSSLPGEINNSVTIGDTTLFVKSDTKAFVKSKTSEGFLYSDKDSALFKVKLNSGLFHSSSGDTQSLTAVPGRLSVTAKYTWKINQTYETSPTDRSQTATYTKSGDNQSQTVYSKCLCCPRMMSTVGSTDPLVGPYFINDETTMSNPGNEDYVPYITCVSKSTGEEKSLYSTLADEGTHKILPTNIYFKVKFKQFPVAKGQGRFNTFRLVLVQTDTGYRKASTPWTSGSNPNLIGNNEVISLSNFNGLNTLDKGVSYQIRIECGCNYSNKIYDGTLSNIYETSRDVNQSNVFIYGGENGFMVAGAPSKAEIIYPYVEDLSTPVVTYSKTPSLMFKVDSPSKGTKIGRVCGIKVEVDETSYWTQVRYTGDAIDNFVSEYDGEFRPYFVKASDNDNSNFKTMNPSKFSVLKFKGDLIGLKFNWPGSEFRYGIGIVSGICPTWNPEENVGSQWSFHNNYIISANGNKLEYGKDYTYRGVRYVKDKKYQYLIINFKNRYTKSDTISISRILYDYVRGSASDEGSLVEFKLPELSQGVHDVKIVVYNNLDPPVINNREIVKLGLPSEEISFKYNYVDLTSRLPSKDSKIVYSDNSSLDKENLFSLEDHLKTCLLSYRNLVGGHDDQEDDNFNKVLNSLFNENSVNYKDSLIESNPTLSWLRALEYCQRVKHWWSGYLQGNFIFKINKETNIDPDGYLDGEPFGIRLIKSLFTSRTRGHYQMINFVHSENTPVNLCKISFTPEDESYHRETYVDKDPEVAINFFKDSVDVREYGVFVSNEGDLAISEGDRYEINVGVSPVTSFPDKTYYHDRYKLLDQGFIGLGDLDYNKEVIESKSSESGLSVSSDDDSRYKGNLFSNVLYGIGQIM